MEYIRHGGISRRELLKLAAAGGAGLLLGPAVVRALSGEVGAAGPDARRVWAWSDSHLGGNVADHAGREGAEWMQLCMKDLKDKLSPVDYALPLGDITDDGTEEQVQQYVELRRAAGVGTWYDLAGNHDYAAVADGCWAKLVDRPIRYIVLDGNCAWFIIGANQGRDVGWQPKPVLAWLRRVLAEHQDKNVIVCTHQPVCGTVASSTGEGAYLSLAGPAKESFPNNAKPFDDLLKEVRVDLWLCGHVHGGKRSPRHIARRGATTFINVSAMGRMYNTGACTSCLLEMRAGQKEMLARCRNHESGAFVEDQQVRVEFPNPWRFAAKPELIPASSGLTPAAVPA